MDPEEAEERSLQGSDWFLGLILRMGVNVYLLLFILSHFTFSANNMYIC